LPASFKVSNLLINPIEAWPNQTITASVDVKNAGSENVSYLFPFSVNGEIVQDVPVQLAGGASTNVTASLNESSVGSYNLNAGRDYFYFGRRFLLHQIFRLGVSWTPHSYSSSFGAG
jgi:hypothetical protein